MKYTTMQMISLKVLEIIIESVTSYMNQRIIYSDGLGTTIYLT